MITSAHPALQIEPSTKLADLIHSDARLLLVANRFSIPLGFRDKTIQEICRQYGVDMDCLLAFMRLMACPERFDVKSFLHLDPLSIVGYLRNSHTYFLEKRLPDIRRHLSAILKDADDASHISVLGFFDEYFREVQEHMGYENQIVFPYIEGLLEGETPAGFTIDEFESHHGNIDEKLMDLKNIIIKYMRLPADDYTVINVLLDIFQSEEDIDVHCFIEDEILVPVIREIEKKRIGNG